jgi:hypothetical protein
MGVAYHAAIAVRRCQLQETVPPAGWWFDPFIPIPFPFLAIAWFHLQPARPLSPIPWHSFLGQCAHPAFHPAFPWAHVRSLCFPIRPPLLHPPPLCPLGLPFCSTIELARPRAWCFNSPFPDQNFPASVTGPEVVRAPVFPRQLRNNKNVPKQSPSPSFPRLFRIPPKFLFSSPLSSALNTTLNTHLLLGAACKTHLDRHLVLSSSSRK